ncbi:MAG: hypothetical protein ACI3XP_08375 [Eubacteriales bacterium]
MRIAILDLMPVLWGMCALAALLLALFGEWGAPARTLPAAAAALILYFAGLPPRVQVAAFAGMFLLDAAVWAALTRLSQYRRKKTAQKPPPPDTVSGDPKAGSELPGS